jgi:hypothetical protein
MRVMQVSSGFHQPVPSILDWKYCIVSIESTEAMRISSGSQQQASSAIACEYIPASTERTALFKTPELVRPTNARECVHFANENIAATDILSQFYVGLRTEVDLRSCHVSIESVAAVRKMSNPCSLVSAATTSRCSVCPKEGVADQCVFRCILAMIFIHSHNNSQRDATKHTHSGTSLLL